MDSPFFFYLAVDILVLALGQFLLHVFGKSRIALVRWGMVTIVLTIAGVRFAGYVQSGPLNDWAFTDDIKSHPGDSELIAQGYYAAREVSPETVLYRRYGSQEIFTLVGTLCFVT